MVKNVLLTAIGLGFVALAIVPMAMGKLPWTSPDPWTGVLFFAGCAVVGIADIVQAYRPAKPEVTPSRVVLRYDRVRLLALGLAGAGWVAAGVVGLWGMMFPGWLSWVLIVFAGLCAALLLPMGLDGRAKVAIDAEGIADYRRLARKIAWHEIEAISDGYLRAMPAIALKLRDPSAHRLSTIGRLLGHTIDPLHVLDFNLNGTTGDIAGAIARFAPPELMARRRYWEEERDWEDDPD